MKKILIMLISKYKKMCLVFMSLVLIFVIVLINKSNKVYASDGDVILDSIKIENQEIEKDKLVVDTIKTYKVDLKGEVINPGVYELEEGKRIIDVIELSGGLKNTAITTNVNLSKKIYDEMVIFIPNEEKNTCDINNTNNEIVTDKNLININTATIDELMSLTGIGQSKAEDIIEYRKNNFFESTEDIKNISGIGDSLYNKIKDEITI